jgi:prepilin-type processing-associated H-X9-DG protein
MQDYDGIYTPAYLNYNNDTTSGPGSPQGDYNRLTCPSFLDLLQPYAKSVQIFDCPSRKTDPSYRLASPVGTTSGNSRQEIGSRILEYGLNMGTGRDNQCDGPGRHYRVANWSWANCAPVKESIVDEPARTIYAGDSYGRSTQGSGQDGEAAVAIFYTTADVGDSAGIPVPHYRHLETANYLFCDGHVKALNKTQALQQKWTNS